MKMLLVKGSEVFQIDQEITQDFLEEVDYGLPHGDPFTKDWSKQMKILRFHDGQFEQLFPHKWKETGGLDRDGPWKEKWEAISSNCRHSPEFTRPKQN